MRKTLGLFLCVLILSAVSGCGDDPAINTDTGQPLIVDGVHNQGTPGFFFLPPLVPPTAYGKTFSAGLSPIVLIDELGGRGTIATFTKTSSDCGSARVVEARGFYYVLWHTRLSKLDSNLIYRVRVQAQGVELGFIDLKVVTSIRELIKFYRTGQWKEYAPVFRDIPLVVPFRIEPAALTCVGVVCAPLDQCHKAGVCDPTTGACSNPAQDDGTICDDGNHCTVDTCRAGVCVGVTVARCPAEFAIPSIDSGPLWIDAGPDGNLWFTEYLAGKIGRITPEGIVTEFAIPTPDSKPWGIVAGNDGNLWFTEFGTGKIGSITPSGAVTEFTIPSGDGFPNGITVGPDNNLWFTEFSTRRIGRITPDGIITEFAIPTANSEPLSIAAGPDGNLWFTEELASKIGRVTPDGSTFAEFALPSADSYPYGIAAGPDGNLWFTEYMNGTIGRITPEGVITEFATQRIDSGPVWIDVGPDGNLWFTEDLAHYIGRITPEGVLTEFANPNVNSTSWVIVAGPDGNLWFTEFSANKIARITP
jgi:streptogramin lyase